MKPGRLLYVITDLETGGVPLHLYRLAQRVRANGWLIHVVSLAPLGPVTTMLRDAGIPTSACDAAGPWDWRALDRLCGVVGDFAPDLVHSFLFHANVACRLAGALGALAPSRLVCEIQTVEVERRWHLVVERLTCRLCRVVVGNSPSVIEHLAQHALVPRDRLFWVPGGIDPDPIRAAPRTHRRDLGLSDTEPVLLWTGRLDPVKGLDDLVAAVAILNRAAPVQVLLAGDGPDRTRIEGVVRQAAMAGCVRMLGRRSDVPSLLGLADVFVFPSLTEGLPNALLEAMAAGLPVVATDVPGNRDAIEAGVSGFLVPPRSPHKLAEAIAILLHDRRLAQRLGQNAARRIDQHFRIDRMVETYLGLYERVLQPQRCG